MKKLFNYSFLVLSLLLPLVVYRFATASSALAKLTLSATISRPTAGEFIRVGSVYPIKWLNSLDVDRVSFNLISSQIKTKLPIVSNIGSSFPDVNTYEWLVNANTGYTGVFKIELIGYNSLVGPSEFVAVTSPDFTILGNGSSLPSVTPTYVPRPTIRPTIIPTPTPAINRPPVVDSSVSYKQRLSKSFLITIKISDPNKDKVSVFITGKMPAGVLSWCNTNGSSANCYLSGTPSKLGSFPFKITAADVRGSKTIKTSTLVITKK